MLYVHFCVRVRDTQQPRNLVFTVVSRLNQLDLGLQNK